MKKNHDNDMRRRTSDFKKICRSLYCCKEVGIVKGWKHAMRKITLPGNLVALARGESQFKELLSVISLVSNKGGIKRQYSLMK